MAIDYNVQSEQIQVLPLTLKSRNWFRLVRLVPKSTGDVAALVTATILINLLALALPIALMQVYDRIIPNSSYATMTWLVIGVIAAIILETIVKIFRSFISNWISARLDHILNTEALAQLLAARLDRYEQNPPGVHFEHFNAINQIKGYMAGQTLIVLLDIPFALLFLGLLYYIGGGLVYYTLGVLSVFTVLVLVCKIGFKSSNDRQVDLNKENLDFILETLGSIHTVKSMSMEDRMLRKYENIQARTSELGLKVNRWKLLPANSAPFFSQLNMLGIIFLGADAVISGQMTIGAMTACTMLATRSFQPLTRMAGFWLKFSEVNTAQAQIAQIINLGSKKNEKPDIPFIKDIQGAVTFHDFVFNPEDTGYNIPPFSAEIFPGQSIGVSGTSHEVTRALMLSICGIYKPGSGKVFIDEYLISDMDHSFFSGRVEYLAPKGRLFNGTILENISMFDPNKNQVALDTAALLEIDTFVADLPNGYETQVDQRANDSLPLGLIQRICFCRLLVTRPRVLIIDRTLNSMDKETHDLVYSVINRLKGKTTMFIVADHGVFPMEPDFFITCTPEGIVIKKNSAEEEREDGPPKMAAVGHADRNNP